MANRTRLAPLLVLALACGGAAPLTTQSSVNDVLDAMQARGTDLKSFTAVLTRTKVDTTFDKTETFRGHATFQALPDGDARLRLILDTKQKGTKPPTPSKREYLLANGWLTDRDYTIRNESHRQVVKPGEKLDLFRLGKGQFPLPIGQDRAEVLRLFTVTAPPAAAGDPPNAIHLHLEPKPGSDLARQYASLDFWVDVAQRMPVRIKTTDAKDVTEETNDLTDVKVNPPLSDADFALEPVQGWNTGDAPQ